MSLRHARLTRIQTTRKRRLLYELLESRQLLAADLDVIDTSHRTSGPITWFESFQSVDRVSLESLSSVDKTLPAGIAGPIEPAVGEWIVQLTDSAAKSLRTLDQGNALLNQAYGDFSIISGLGIEGLLLVRGRGATKSVLESSLSQNESVKSYSLNQLIEGQSTTPNDPEFVAGLMPGMERIDATNAWDVSRGSSSTVVGVVDTGIDPVHPDLYLNIWLNQGELPRKYLDDDGPKLVDIDSDGLITFYDLNNVTRSATTPYSLTFGGFATGPNASFVSDKNSNGRIDATDLLADANWADGRDTDNNGFFDDFFGVNFRTGAGDPFAANNPADELGHGTHVAGTIGAIGGNASGVVGVNWQTSLMSLRILDNNNQGDSGAAIRAINYAREMRERYRVDTAGRVTEGANVRVLNNSWGQPGGYEVSLETAIQDSSDAGILFVAAAGNGNFLGQGVDNDRTPFYPASYNVAGVIAVAASDASDRPASFSNYGAKSVDLFAPGVGIRSTLPGGGYGSANGTSMASPHVAGTAALIWSAFPEATVVEIQRAILSTVGPIANGSLYVATGGRLSSSKAINADVFAPAAHLVSKQDITTAGGTSTEFTVEYSHRSGIDATTIGNDDLIVTRQWGPADQLLATLKPSSITTTTRTATATYIVTAPGGTWDALDFGDYVISTVAGKVKSLVGNKTTESRDIGLFNVRIQDPSVSYVSTFADSLEPGTLRSAIIAANAAAPSRRTIILDSGRYTIDIPHVSDPMSVFPFPNPKLFCGAVEHTGGWSNESTGDFDILGNISLVGDLNDHTVIDGNRLDRVFKVHSGASLELARVSVTGGLSPVDQGGGGILSVGTLTVRDSNIRNNLALGMSINNPIRGGGIAAWDGTTNVFQSWITENESNYGGALFFCETASGIVSQSTLSANNGGGLHSHSDMNVSVTNSTFSGNRGGQGAVFNGKRDGFDVVPGSFSVSPSLSTGGRFVAFASNANLVPGTSSVSGGVFVFDRLSNRTERVSVSDTGAAANNTTANPSLSADGRFVAFESSASNLVPGDTSTSDIFVYDRQSDLIERVSVSNNGAGGDNASFNSSLSADGRFVAFQSFARNLVLGDQSNGYAIFVYDRQSDTIERISISSTGAVADSSSVNPSISADGRFVAFQSAATNLVPNDTNGKSDIFIYDRQNDTIERIAVSTAVGAQNETSGAPSLSGDGRFVAFESDATDLVSDDTNSNTDVFVFDRQNGRTKRVSVSNQGVEGNGSSVNPALSANGNAVAFFSNATNLVSGSSSSGMYFYDLKTGTIEQVATSGITPSLSGDGHIVAIVSRSTNLLPNDPSINNFEDVFVYDRQTAQFTSPAIFPTDSLIDVSQTTVAVTTETAFSIGGRVQLNDVLLSNEVVGINGARITQNNVIQSNATGAERIRPLASINHLPPVHTLISGNPAIDSGDRRLTGTVDQRGVTRVTPDVGAIETVSGTLAGKVFVDVNRDQLRDPTESGVPDVKIRAKQLGVASNLRSVTSRSDDLNTPLTDETGDYEIIDLPFANYDIEVVLQSGWRLSESGIRRAPSLQPDAFANFPSLSGDGRFVAFQSAANNLVPGDTGALDVFVSDLQTGAIERVSVRSDGTQANGSSTTPSLSGDGRFVAFSSFANVLVPGDTNAVQDIFVYDRLNRLSERVSITSGGVEGNGNSFDPSISADGRFVSFLSDTTNLVLGDTNGQTDVFVYDRQTDTIKRVSVGSDGTQADSASFYPSLSSNGRFVSFATAASNLVLGDTNVRADVFLYDTQNNTIERVSVTDTGTQAIGGQSGSTESALSEDGRFVAFESTAINLIQGEANLTPNVFLYDRQNGTVERVSRSNAGIQGNAASYFPSLSNDGRFVSFLSDATNLVSGDTNLDSDVFLYDRDKKSIERISISRTETQANGSNQYASLSGNGRMIAFHSSASNLVPGDTNNTTDVFVTLNSLIEPGATRTILAGDLITDFNFGLVPDPGAISGRLFEDSVSNSVFDVGEKALASWTVYLDTNNNGLFDRNETTTISNPDGVYEFLNVPSFTGHTIRVVVPTGWTQVSPASSDKFAWNIFLPAGGTVTDRDFAIRRVQSTGQSSASAVSGRLYDDRNGNRVYDAGDVPIANREVYLDATNFGVRDADESRVLTDAQGVYSMDGLSSRTVAVSTTLDSGLVHVTPLGSNFTVQKFPLYSSVRPFSNPQDIASGDFNQDGFLDVALALGEANKLSIRLNNGQGGFLATEIDMDLGSDGAGPTSLVVGQFDNDSRLDVALTANYSSKVSVLLNYNPTTRTFASQTAVNVGLLPIDIVAGQFGGDSKLDLAVVNQGSTTVASTVQLLTNNGSGVFTAGTAIPTGGKTSVSIVAGNFAGDASTDIAIVHASPSTTTTPNGGVTILRGNGAGGLTLEPSYHQVGALPIDSVSTDFNGDGRADMAVANFSSNSISILLGQANGTLRVQTEILGTASGAFDITVGDIDNDGDMDVIASNLKDRNISIFRNTGVDPTTGDVRFEPLENVGLGQFSLAQRMPLVVENFDNDRSGPGGTGTLDIVTIPQRTDTLHVLNNKLVNGSRRVALTGTNSISGLNFIIKSAILPPTFNDIANPAAIVEDAAEQTLTFVGIKKGRATGPALRFTITRSAPSLIASTAVSFVDGSASATLRYTTLPNANGASVITVRAIDAGANQLFDDNDDGVFERSFTVTVLEVNDAPTMTIPSLTSVTQKASAQSLLNFVTGISSGGGNDEASQILSAFSLTFDTTYFAVMPAISSNGTLSFTPSPNQSGIVLVGVKLSDSGGVAHGGVDTTTKNFVLNILPVNDPPTFTLAGNSTIQAGTGPQTLTGFATSFAPGGGVDELSQVISDYLVTVDSPGLFTVLPTIANDGTLTFTPATDRNGIATVSVRVRDNGGTLNGGVDLSSTKTFTIVVGSAQIITLNASELGPHEIAIRNGFLVVTAGGSTARSVPVADLTKVTTVDGVGTKLFEVTLPAINLPGMVRFTGTGKPIELIAERTAIDLSILTSDKLFGIELVDLRAVGPNSLAFRASDVSALNGPKTLRILMDREDTLSAPGNWRAQSGGMENGVWVQPFTNAGARIEVISATPWQNKVNRHDIDGDQAVTPLDVLVLVNLINSNSFPNGQLPSRGSTQPDGFFDPDGDHSVGPLDVLTLVNELNRGGGASGEGEGANQSQWVDQVMATEFADLEWEPRPTGLAKRKLGNRR